MRLGAYSVVRASSRRLPKWLARRFRSPRNAGASASERTGSCLAGVVEKNEVFLRFTNRELRQVIEEPARRVGLVFDPGVVDRLLADVQGDPAVAPLLQFSLLQLWDNRTGNRITSQTYEHFRGGRFALERAAERAFQHFDKDSQDIARRLFLANRAAASA